MRPILAAFLTALAWLLRKLCNGKKVPLQTLVKDSCVVLKFEFYTPPFDGSDDVPSDICWYHLAYQNQDSWAFGVMLLGQDFNFESLTIAAGHDLVALKGVVGNRDAEDFADIWSLFGIDNAARAFRDMNFDMAICVRFDRIADLNLVQPVTDSRSFVRWLSGSVEPICSIVV